jgi:hypothetical protein
VREECATTVEVKQEKVKNIKLFAVFGIGSLATVHVIGRTSNNIDKERKKHNAQTEVTIFGCDGFRED